MKSFFISVSFFLPECQYNGIQENNEQYEREYKRREHELYGLEYIFLLIRKYSLI